MSDLDVAVVIVTYQSAPDIEACLRTLPMQRLCGVVVVDNASTDGTADLVESLDHPQLRLLRLSRNTGFGAGCNAGLRVAPPSAQVLFLNPDAEIDGESLERLSGHLDSNPKVGLVAPQVMSGSCPRTSYGSFATARSELRLLLPPALAARFPDRRAKPLAQTSRVEVVEGAAMMFDRTAFDAIGGFDERYFLFFEEHDVARRLEVGGWEVHVCGEAVVNHKVGRSRAHAPDNARAAYWRSAMTFLRTWGRPWSAPLLRVVGMTLVRSRSRFGSLDPVTAETIQRALRAP